MKALVFALPALAFTAGIAEAGECGGFATVFNFCKRCVTVMERTTSRDTACTNTMRTTPPTVQNRSLIIVGTRLDRAPANGRVVVTQGSFTYAPKKGFIGRDSFRVEYDFLEQGEVLVSFGEFNMDVKP